MGESLYSGVTGSKGRFFSQLKVFTFSLNIDESKDAKQQVSLIQKSDLRSTYPPSLGVLLTEERKGSVHNKTASILGFSSELGIFCDKEKQNFVKFISLSLLCSLCLAVHD